MGDKSFFAHKFVLANCSEVLKTMLYEDRWCDPQSPMITLSETEECQSVFEPFLKFFYTATIELNLNNVIGRLNIIFVLSSSDRWTHNPTAHLYANLINNAI